MSYIRFMEFFKKTVPESLEKLNEDTERVWGTMSPQAMVEHLVGTWMISNGRAKVDLAVPEDSLPKRRAFLFSDKEYARGIPNPVFGGKEQPLRKPDLSAAKEALLKEIDRFFEHHEENPGLIYTHPVFGDLDFEGWLTFQKKHMGHHLRQFGLID